MKFIFLPFFLHLAFTAPILMHAQDNVIRPSIIITGEYLGETPPLRDLPTITDAEWQIMVEKAERKMLNPKLKIRSYPYAETALPRGPDPAWQREMGNNRDTRAPLQNFNGSDSPYMPSDANGTIGPNYYMQTINTVYTIFNRAGSIVAGPTAVNTLFYGVAGSNYNDGDPIVLYDEQADRWLVAEFSITGSNDYMLIAVSTSNDPTGTWYKYAFDVSDVPDYEKFGIWQDGYYMGTNTYNGGDIYVFQRSQMLSGSAPMGVGFDNPWRPGPYNAFNCVPPLDNDGDFAPAGDPGLFIAFNDDAIGGGSDQLWVYELDVDWATPANSTFSRTQQIAVASFDSNFGTDMANIKQQGTTQEVDAIPQVIMNPPQYRNFGSYETILCCHTVDVDNTDHAGIRWYELRRVSGGDWTIRQQSTYAPADAHSRWMGSIMLNGSNEIALGYSISSSTMYPGIRYCGQSATAYAAAAGTLDVAEEIILTGTNSQSTYPRWGDYSAMQVDPTDDETFWFTTEYTGAGNIKKTKIANFQIGTVIFTANFAVSNTNPQAFSTVTFTDVSFGSPANWSWTISPATFNYVGGTSASSQNPQVQFIAAGDYTVTLSASNGGSSDSETKTNFINVIDCGYLYLPFTEDFSDGVMPPCWKNIDNVGNGQAWLFNNPGNRPVHTASYENGFAILDSYYYGPGYTQNADLITPVLDLSDYTAVNLYFEHFFPYFGSSTTGKLSYSINGGCTWTVLQTWTNSANPSIVNLNVTQVIGQSRVRFKWNYTGTYGYYWAIDDISITGTGPNRWTGTTSGDWATATNWSTGTVPTSTSNVIIPASASNWPALNGDFSLGTSCDKITLYGGAQLTVSGNVTITPGKTLAFIGNGQINLSGNWINQGMFIPGSGTVQFTGTSPSAIIPPTITTSTITNYQPSTFPKSMTVLTGATTGPTGDNSSSNVAIGFTLNYLGTNYTQARICTNGWLSLSTSNVTSNDNARLFNTSTPNLTLAPWFDDLTDDATSIVGYKTEGTAPYRVFTAEWKSVPTYSSEANARISFQVKLFETTNIIEFHYGSLTGTGHSGSESASIGIEDATGGSGHFIDATTGLSTTGNPNLISTNDWPTVNYRFSPPSSTLTFHNITVDKSGTYVDIFANTVINGNLTITNGNVSGPTTASGTLNVKGNWSNNGTYTPGSGTVVLNGTTNQNVGGSSATTFSNLTLNNSAGITLLNNETVSGTLTMTSGNIDCGSNTLELGTSASATGTLSWTAGNIIGNYKRWIAVSTVTAIDFPVGTAANNHNARITFSNNTGGSLTAKFEPGDPGNNTGFPLTEDSRTINANDLFTEGSWTLVPNTLTSTSYALELSGTGFSSAGAPDETVRILKRPDGGDDWALNGTHVAGSAPIAKRSDLSGFSRFILAKPGHTNKISGSLKYHNQANTPIISGITLKLYKDGSQVGSDYTVTNGTYEFSGLNPGTYEIRASSSNTTDGSINTTDAAQTNYWGALPFEIEKVRFYAGDVTGVSFFINSSDALRIQSNFVNGTAFDKGTWAFWKTGETISSNSNPSESYTSVTIAGSDVTAHIYGLCAGDFNRSFTPGLKKSASTTLDLIYTGNRQVGSNQEFELPLQIVNAASVGAVSLILNFPLEFVEVKDVTMSNAGGQIDWAVKGNELRIGWHSQNPVSLTANAELLNLKLKTTEAFLPGNSIKLTLALNPLNELADAIYEVIGNAVISVEVIDATAMSIYEQSASDAITVSCHPNPFSNFTTISYTLPFGGEVHLEINSILGKKVAALVNEIQAPGDHSVKFNIFGLPAGVYTATLRLRSANDEKIRTIKLVNNK